MVFMDGYQSTPERFQIPRVDTFGKGYLAMASCKIPLDLFDACNLPISVMCRRVVLPRRQPYVLSIFAPVGKQGNPQNR